MEAEVANRKAALAQAEANYERDQAQARNARSQANRYAALTTKGIIAREQNEQSQTTALAAEKAVAASRASIESAKAAIQGAEAKLGDARLQLSYATIRAPISGRAGNLMRKTGNLVAANDANPLVTINQISPVYATFSAPEQSLAEIRRYSTGGKLRVQAIPQGAAAGEAAVGYLDFVDNRVDPATGTIMLKARFPNREKAVVAGAVRERDRSFGIADRDGCAFDGGEDRTTGQLRLCRQSRIPRRSSERSKRRARTKI